MMNFSHEKLRSRAVFRDFKEKSAKTGSSSGAF